MSRFDQEREELIRLIISICDYARVGYNLSTYNDCNNCGDKDCKYIPRIGEVTRINCPLWKARE